METKTKEFKLTNKDISDNFSDESFYLMKHNFIGAFAKNVYAMGVDILNDEYKAAAVKEYGEFLNIHFKSHDYVIHANYQEVHNLTSVDLFEMLPNVITLNNFDLFGSSFISIGALSRNVFYDILRDYISTKWPK